MTNGRGFAMAAAIKVRSDYDADGLRALAKQSKDANQTRRLLACQRRSEWLPGRRSKMGSSFFCVHIFEMKFLVTLTGAASTRRRRRSNPARPYMDRLMTFNRLIWPSTGPVL